MGILFIGVLPVLEDPDLQVMDRILGGGGGNDFSVGLGLHCGGCRHLQRNVEPVSVVVGVGIVVVAGDRDGRQQQESYERTQFHLLQDNGFRV